MNKQYLPAKMLASILINNYNNERFIKQCVQSALEQTYSPLEVIVYDDGSTDSSVEILKSFGDKIKLIAAERNFGQAKSFNQMNAINTAFELSSGECVCLLDGDDAFYPNKVEEIMEVFSEDTAVVMVHHNMIEINEKGMVGNTAYPKAVIKPLQHGWSYHDFIFYYDYCLLLFSPTSGQCYRRSYLNKVMPLKADGLDLIWADARLARRAVFYGKLTHINKVLGFYRNHSSNWSNMDAKRIKAQVTRQMYAYFNNLEEMKNRRNLSYVRYRIKKWTTLFFIKRKLTNLLGYSK